MSNEQNETAVVVADAVAETPAPVKPKRSSASKPSAKSSKGGKAGNKGGKPAAKPANAKPGRKAKAAPTSVIPVDFRRPRNPDTVLDIAVNGGNVNRGRLTPQQYMAMHTAFANSEGPGIVLYQPALAQIAADGSGLVATCGRGKSQPADWHDSLGKWGCITDENKKITSGDVINPVRLHHNRDLRKRCVDGGCLEIPGIGPVVLGIHAVNPQTTGNYAFIVEVAKQQVFGDNPQLAKLVGLINVEPCIETLEHDGQIVWASYNAIDWGYLVRNGKRLTHEQIRKLGEDASGVSFEALETPIVGTAISVAKLVTAIKAAMSKASTKRDGENETAWDRFGWADDEQARAAVTLNITTLTRFDPRSMNCFGLRNVQAGCPLFFSFSDDGETRMVNMAVGCRLPLEYAETQWDANARVKGSETETETESEAPAKKTTKRQRKAVEAVTTSEPAAAEPTASGGVSIEITDAVGDSTTTTVTSEAAPPVEDTGEMTAADVDAAESTV